MAHAGFLNDNEYRQYPLIPRPTSPINTGLIVDCGFIMGIDSGYTPGSDIVYVSAIHRVGNALKIEFRTTAAAAANFPIIFTRAIDSTEWETEFIETAPASVPCATEPMWEGFLVTGQVADTFAELSAGATKTLNNYVATVEPGRVQSLKNGYLRSVNVGNYPRITAPPCGSSGASQGSANTVIVNATCLAGDIKIRPGYNCDITQQKYANTLTISALKDANTANADADELCENSGEVPLYPNEPNELKPLLVLGGADRSKFLSGGVACDQVITSINGLKGPDVRIVSGSGIRVIADPNDEHGIRLVPADNVVTNKC